MKLMPTMQDYDEAFAEEAAHDYAEVTLLERRLGYALNRDILERAARVLACPIKAHAPNWQHGRVLYALARTRLSTFGDAFATLLDIGTAKGFSALCLEWARRDSGCRGAVITLDVIDPASRVRRNTVAETRGLLTLDETLAGWPEADNITALHDTGVEWLERTTINRLPVVFVDGKHRYDVVRREAELIAAKQQPGDLVMFDDAHLDEVARAVREQHRHYDLEWFPLLDHRAYVFGWRL